MKKLVIVLVVLLVIAGVLAGVYFFTPLFKGKKASDIRYFEDCEEAGGLVVDTHPRECHMKDDRVFIEEGNAFEYKDVIEVTDPTPRLVVDSPFKVEGKAMGIWFYNKQLSMKLLDENQEVIGVGFAKAQEEIEEGSTEFVPFIGVMHFRAPSSGKGSLLIEKTNPVEKDADENPIKPGPLIVPVLFNFNPTATPTVPPTPTVPAAK
jgi:hypothetical protein